MSTCEHQHRLRVFYHLQKSTCLSQTLAPAADTVRKKKGGQKGLFSHQLMPSISLCTIGQFTERKKKLFEEGPSTPKIQKCEPSHAIRSVNNSREIQNSLWTNNPFLNGHVELEFKSSSEWEGWTPRAWSWLDMQQIRTSLHCSSTTCTDKCDGRSFLQSVIIFLIIDGRLNLQLKPLFKTHLYPKIGRRYTLLLYSREGCVANDWK